ncbi:MAG: hypothetical protein HKP60_07635 [Eudoraea sp.]|nr:hypothetical protein [Eudoraea sp.]NNJ40722.1 hypothetical protein [Eudoraea sp.]
MKKNDLHTQKKEAISRLHKEKLGMEVPENYFANSRSSIMEKVSSSEKKTTSVFYMRPVFRYAIAATVILLVSLGITLKILSDSDSDVIIPSEENLELASMADDDYLITSILVSNEDLEFFLDQYLLEGILVKAELNEQEFDNVFMNSLLVKDSLIDTYIDDHFIDDIIF